MVRGGSIIMPGVASKALEMFARMAHGQTCISIDDKQTEELQDNEWKIIREIGCGLSNKEIAGWAADAVLWANQNHIINGRKSGDTVTVHVGGENEEQVAADLEAFMQENL